MQILVQVACGYHLVLINQIKWLCFSLYIKHYTLRTFLS